ncbi:hypothetical protein AADG42_11505 [Ammonicoccus fulvus]|uniref:Knr4/Smi1-like domain-containing protein n=1 Tax=Ammonicoccus fulvus TaxID=3138240 RepID=A0ABZ3FQC8_9ACTN
MSRRIWVERTDVQPAMDPHRILAVLPEPHALDGGEFVFRWFGADNERLTFYEKSCCVESPSEATTCVFEQLCRAHGWTMSEEGDGEPWTPWSDPQSPLAEALENGLFPYRELGEPGWAERTRTYLTTRVETLPQPCSHAEWVALEARCGPLPDLLRIWLTELGGMPGVADITTVRPLPDTSTFGALPESDRQRFRHAVALTDGGAVFLPAPTEHDECFLFVDGSLQVTPLWQFLESLVDESIDETGFRLDSAAPAARLLRNVWRLGTAPTGIGAPGWPDRAREYLRIARKETIVPVSPADLVAAVARCGGLPPRLIEFLTQLGEPCGCLRVEGLRRASDTPAYARLRPDLQDRYRNAIALDESGLRLLDARAAFRYVDYSASWVRRHDLAHFLRTRLTPGCPDHTDLGWGIHETFDKDPWAAVSAPPPPPRRSWRTPG